MATEILEVLLRVNLATAAAVVAVLLLRSHLRRAAGSRVAYALWLAVPVAAVGSLLPARKIVAALPVSANEASALGERVGAIAGSGSSAAGPAVLPFDWTAFAIALWAAGAVAGVAWLVWRQRRFLARVTRGGDGALAPGVGPAVVGAIAPKILLPVDFDDRFSPKERDVVLAHEEFHLRQGHAQTNALMLISQCVNWFNPALHVAARAIRLDQEMACDEAVVARFPKARRTYAEAMLKTQLTPDLVLGCYWPAKGSALRQRLSLLKAPRPSRKAAISGAASTLALTLAAGLAAWAAQPPTTVFKPAPAAKRPIVVAHATEWRVEPVVAAPAVPPPAPAQAVPSPPESASSPQETLAVPDIAEDSREMAALASAKAPSQLEEARASLVEEVDQTRRRLETRRGRVSEEQRRELEAEHRAAETALRMFDGELERFGGLERLVQISSNASAKATSAYANVSAHSAAWASSSASNEKGRGRNYGPREAAQPRRDPTELEPGARIYIQTRLDLSDGQWIGGNAVFSKNGSADAQEGGYNGDRRYSMASSVRQIGDQVEVRPKVLLDGKLVGSGRGLIPSGETAYITLDNGMVVRAKARIQRSPPKRCCAT